MMMLTLGLAWNKRFPITWRKMLPKLRGRVVMSTCFYASRRREKEPFGVDRASPRSHIFNVNDAIPSDIIKHCVELAMRYKTLKNKPMLGI